MDLPRLMMACGDDDNKELLDSQISKVKISEKDLKNKKIWNVWLILDLDKKVVRFERFAYQRETSEKEYYYMGNNQSAAMQLYVVRDASSMINYWTGRMEGILCNLLKWNLLPDGALKMLLQECLDCNLFSNNGIVFSAIANQKVVDFQINAKKKFVINGIENNAEAWLANYLGTTKNDKLALIIPCIVKNDTKIVISKDPDYLSAVNIYLSGNVQSGGKKNKKSERVCHICGKKTDTVDTLIYAKKMERSSISKVFVTTPVNYASGFDKKNHQKNFSICKDCYEKWHGSERMVMNDFRVRIAGANAIILTEGILKKINRDGISRINQKIEDAFDLKEFQEWSEEFAIDYLDDQDIDLYEFNLLFYQSDGKYCFVYYSIEDVQNIWFDEVLAAFKEIRLLERYAKVLPYFGLGSIYKMIPVREYGKDKKQDIHEVLDLYSRILRKQKIFRKEIFDKFSEAMDCGHHIMISSEVRNYKNLHKIQYLHERVQQKDIRGMEWYIQYMCYAYQGLLDVLEKLELTDKRKGATRMPVNHEGKSYKIVADKENYLQQMCYSDVEKGLYYIGAMMYQVGQMQYVQGHKNKPILEKINYSGMNVREIVELLNELHDKIRQYRKAMEAKGKGYLVFYAELFSEKAYEYLGNLPKERNLNDHENLFYIMSGYSSCISVTKNEEESEND